MFLLILLRIWEFIKISAKEITRGQFGKIDSNFKGNIWRNVQKPMKGRLICFFAVACEEDAASSSPWDSKLRLTVFVITLGRVLDMPYSRSVKANRWLQYVNRPIILIILLFGSFAWIFEIACQQQLKFNWRPASGLPRLPALPQIQHLTSAMLSECQAKESTTGTTNTCISQCWRYVVVVASTFKANL